MRATDASVFPQLSPRAGRGRIAPAIRVRGRLNEGSRNGFKNIQHIAQHISFPHGETPPYPDCFAVRPLPARGERFTQRSST
jgi:hypothetical protein